MMSDNIINFYSCLQTNKNHAQHLMDLRGKYKEETLSSEQTINFLKNDLIPFAQTLGFNFSLEDILNFEYGKEGLYPLSEEQLDLISGGVGLRAFAALGLCSAGLTMSFIGLVPEETKQMIGNSIGSSISSMAINMDISTDMDKIVNDEVDTLNTTISSPKTKLSDYNAPLQNYKGTPKENGSLDTSNITLSDENKTVSFLLSNAKAGKSAQPDEEANGWRDRKKDVLFEHNPLVTDVKQGTLGDCYLLSSLISIANTSPEMIENCMKDNNDGTVTVRLYDENFSPKFFRVTKETPSKNGKDIYAQDTLWVQILEKAVVKSGFLSNAENKNNNERTYGQIIGGQPSKIIEMITGKKCETTIVNAYKVNKFKKCFEQMKENQKFDIYKKSITNSSGAQVNKQTKDCFLKIIQLSLDAHQGFEQFVKSNKGHNEHLVSTQDFDALSNYVNEVMNSMGNEKYERKGPKGSGLYTEQDEKNWETVKKAIDFKMPCCMSLTSLTGNSEENANNNEKKDKGRVYNHSYSVIDYKEENGVKYVLIQNPWKYYSLEYKSTTRVKQDKDGNNNKVKGLDTEEKNSSDGSSWMELSQFTKYLYALYTPQTDAAQPNLPSAENIQENDIKRFESQLLKTNSEEYSALKMQAICHRLSNIISPYLRNEFADNIRCSEDWDNLSKEQLRFIVSLRKYQELNKKNKKNNVESAKQIANNSLMNLKKLSAEYLTSTHNEDYTIEKQNICQNILEMTSLLQNNIDDLF